MGSDIPGQAGETSRAPPKPHRAQLHRRVELGEAMGRGGLHASLNPETADRPGTRSHVRTADHPEPSDTNTPRSG